MIRAVTFDADGTLWDFEQAMRDALAVALLELQGLVPRHAAARAAALTLADLAATRDRVAAELRPANPTLEQVRIAAFARKLEELGSPDPALASHLFERYVEHRYAATRPYDDVLPTLDALAGLDPGPIVGLISNGNTDPARCGLSGRFQFALYASPRAAAKPDRHLFDLALREARCEPSALVHVGDSLANDVAGARALGIRAVWLNRDGLPNTTTIMPDAEIATLAELPDLIGEPPRAGR